MWPPYEAPQKTAGDDRFARPDVAELTIELATKHLPAGAGADEWGCPTIRTTRSRGHA